MAREIRQDTEMKEAQVEEYFKLLLLSDESVLYLRCTKDPTWKLLDVINIKSIYKIRHFSVDHSRRWWEIN